MDTDKDTPGEVNDPVDAVGEECLAAIEAVAHESFNFK